MTLYELRLLGVLGIVAIGIIAVVVMLAITAFGRLARRLDGRIARARVLPSLGGDAHSDVARLVDRRQAIWRLRC